MHNTMLPMNASSDCTFLLVEHSAQQRLKPTMQEAFDMHDVLQVEKLLDIQVSVW